MGQEKHTSKVIWGYQRGTTNDNFKQLYSHITSHMVSQSLDMTSHDFSYAPLELHTTHKTSKTLHITPKDSLGGGKIIMDLIIN